MCIYIYIYICIHIVIIIIIIIHRRSVSVSRVVWLQTRVAATPKLKHPSRLYYIKLLHEPYVILQHEQWYWLLWHYTSYCVMTYCVIWYNVRLYHIISYYIIVYNILHTRVVFLVYRRRHWASGSRASPRSTWRPHTTAGPRPPRPAFDCAPVCYFARAVVLFCIDLFISWYLSACIIKQIMYIYIYIYIHRHIYIYIYIYTHI